MEQDFFTKLTSTLHDVGYADNELHLERTASGKVGGHILSHKFQGETQMDRQDKLWNELEKRLTPEELRKIVALLTVTPAEIGEDNS